MDPISTNNSTPYRPILKRSREEIPSDILTNITPNLELNLLKRRTFTQNDEQSAEAKVTKAKILLNLNLVQKAMKLLEEAKALGSHEAFFLCGTIYRNGDYGLPKNPEKALEHFEAMALLNCHIEPTYCEGIYYLAQYYNAEQRIDRFDQLNKTITLLKKTYSNAPPEYDRFDLFKLLVKLYKERISHYVNKIKETTSQEEKNQLLYLAIQDCNYIFKSEPDPGEEFISYCIKIFQELKKMPSELAPVDDHEARNGKVQFASEPQIFTYPVHDPSKNRKTPRRSFLKKTSRKFLRHMAELFIEKAEEKIAPAKRQILLNNAREILADVAKVLRDTDTRDLIISLYRGYSAMYLDASNATDIEEKKAAFLKLSNDYKILEKQAAE